MQRYTATETLLSWRFEKTELSLVPVTKISKTKPVFETTVFQNKFAFCHIKPIHREN